MKTYDVSIGNERYIVELKKEKYAVNGRLAVQLFTVPEHEPFATITTNIAYPLSGDAKTHAFIDTNNCFWKVEEFLQKNGIARPTDYYGASGYCKYPEYCFDLSKFGD